MTTVRVVLVVAAIEEWHTFQMDLTNAFLHGELYENVYMKLPQGYTHLGGRVKVNVILEKSYTTLVCKITK